MSAGRALLRSMVVPPRSSPQEPLSDVLAGLPASVATALDTGPMATAVRALLTAGWRPAQLGARIGALPATDDPASHVHGFLVALADEESPTDRASRERAERAAQAAAQQPDGPPASAETVAACLAQVRSHLLALRSRRPPRRESAPLPSADPAAAEGQQSLEVTVQPEPANG